MSGAGASQDSGVRLGIIAGGGSLPFEVAKAAQEAGHRPFIIALAGNAGKDIEQFPHAYIGVGQIGRMLRLLRREKCSAIVIVGSLRRPNLLRLKFDSGFVWNLPTLLRLMKGGDDSLMRRIARFFEERGFELRASHDFAPNLLAPAGIFSRAKPSPEAMGDIKLGFQVAKALGAFDIGQAVVVAQNYVLAVEAAEGTDAMIARCGPLNKWGVKEKRGVLVKAPKPGQDMRLDLPAIGPKTVELAAASSLAGIAVQAHQVLLADQAALVEKADSLGLFLYGVRADEI